MRVMQFGINKLLNANAWRKFGNKQFGVGLADGRELAMAGAASQVQEGALFIFDPQGEPLLILAPGCWVHCYPASVSDGSPASIVELAKPTE